jgi:predicted PhzF superfamily epimerase YddE/YHI9
VAAIERAMAAAVDEGGQQWDDDAATGTARGVIEAVLRHLAALARPYKYVVTAALTQGAGAGMHSAVGCVWDAGRDEVVRVKCGAGMLTVFAVAAAPAPDQPEPLQDDDE